MNIAIVGSRGYDGAHANSLIPRVVRRLIQVYGEFTLVSGGCPDGADTISEHAVRAIDGMPNPIIFLANSEKAKQAFGPVFRDRAFGRNKWIVDNAELCVAFFSGTYNPNAKNDGMKGGTLNTVNHAFRKGIKVQAYFAKSDRWVTYPAVEVTGL